jgi:hypothetical protein
MVTLHPIQVIMVLHQDMAPHRELHLQGMGTHIHHLVLIMVRVHIPAMAILRLAMEPLHLVTDIHHLGMEI